MPRRPATVTQADIARAIRAARATGLPIRRIVVRPDGVSVETAEGDALREAEQYQDEVADSEPLVLL